jgi:transposase
MGQVTVFSGPERRRRWSAEERLQILTDAFSPGACVADVSRRHDVSTALIYTWRRKFRDAQVEAASSRAGPASPDPEFAEAVLFDAGGTPSPDHRPALVVELAKGRRLQVFATASPALVAAALKALR